MGGAEARYVDVNACGKTKKPDDGCPFSNGREIKQADELYTSCVEL